MSLDLVGEGVTWLVGDGFTFKVPEAFADVILPHLREVWEQTNDMMTVLLELAQMGGVCGDVFVLVVPQDPTPSERFMNPYVKTHIKIHVLGSESVFPIWDPMKTDRLLAVKIVTLYVDQSDMDSAQPSGPDNTKRFIQIIYPDQIIEYVQGEIGRASCRERV